MWYLILIIIILVLILKSTTEKFIPLNDLYKKDKLKYIPKEIPYSNFLIDLNNNFKNELDALQPKSSSFVVGGNNPKVLCDDHLKLEVENKALNKSFNKISNSYSYPNLLVFENSNDNQRNQFDQEAYIKPKANEISISDENKYSNNRYISKIDPGLKNQNNKKIILDIKFQDALARDFNYSTEKNNDIDIDPCVYKANLLSEYTNPKLYCSDNTRFPPRFMKNSPYKNIPLPKTINLKLFNDMLNCCQNNF